MTERGRRSWLTVVFLAPTDAELLRIEKVGWVDVIEESVSRGIILLRTSFDPPIGIVSPLFDLFTVPEAAFRGVAMNRFVSNPWITTIGGMCYTIYLLHNYVIAGLGIASQHANAGSFLTRLLIQFVLLTPAVLLVSALYFRFV